MRKLSRQSPSIEGENSEELLLGHLCRDGGVISHSPARLACDSGTNDCGMECVRQNVHNSRGSLAIPVFRHASALFPSRLQADGFLYALSPGPREGICS